MKRTAAKAHKGDLPQRSDSEREDVGPEGRGLEGRNVSALVPSDLSVLLLDEPTLLDPNKRIGGNDNHNVGSKKPKRSHGVMAAHMESAGGDDQPRRATETDAKSPVHVHAESPPPMLRGHGEDRSTGVEAEASKVEEAGKVETEAGKVKEAGQVEAGAGKVEAEAGKVEDGVESAAALVERLRREAAAAAAVSAGEAGGDDEADSWISKLQLQVAARLEESLLAQHLREEATLSIAADRDGSNSSSSFSDADNSSDANAEESTEVATEMHQDNLGPLDWNMSAVSSGSRMEGEESMEDNEEEMEY
jgi:hypothetical protein